MINRRCATCLVTNISSIKFVFHITNLLCAFACIQLIVFGITNLMDIEELDAVPSGQFINSPHIITIILGGLLLVNSCYGFLSAAKQLPISMKYYALMQLNIFVFCIITLWISNIEESMANAFQYVWDNRMANDKFKAVVASIQSKLTCCEMNGPNDYNSSNSQLYPYIRPCPDFIELPSCRRAVGDWALLVYVRFVSSIVPTAVIVSATFILAYYFASAIVFKPLMEREQNIFHYEL